MEKLRNLKDGSTRKVVSKNRARFENLVKDHKKLLHAIGDL